MARGLASDDDKQRIVRLSDPSRRQLCIVLLRISSSDLMLHCWLVVGWFLWLLAPIAVSTSTIEIDDVVGFSCSRRSDDDDALVLR